MANTTQAEDKTKLFLDMLPTVTALISVAARTFAGSNGAAIAGYLDLLTVLVREAASSYEELRTLRQLIARMIAEEREPTEEEWAAVLSRSDTAHNVIQGTDLSDAETA